MAQVYVDPEKLRSFAKQLKSFVSFIESTSVMINSQLYLLKETWRDKQYEKFKEQFDKTMKAVPKFLDVASKEVVFLERSAKDTEEYLKQK